MKETQWKPDDRGRYISKDGSYYAMKHQSFARKWVLFYVDKDLGNALRLGGEENSLSDCMYRARMRDSRRKIRR